MLCSILTYPFYFIVQLMGFLHTLGMSIPAKSKLPMLDELGLHVINGSEDVSALSNGKTIKITVDNIDGA